MDKEKRRFCFGIFLVAVASITLFCALQNISTVLHYLKKLIGVFSPVIYGFCAAYVINVFMYPFEKLWDKIFKGKKTKLQKGLKKGICLILSMALVLGIIAAILFMVIPELIETVNDLLDLFPPFWAKVENFFDAKLEKYNVSIPHIQFDSKEVQNTLFELLPKIGTGFFNTVIGIVTTIFSTVFNACVVIIFAIYMILNKEKMCRGFKKILYAVARKERADAVVGYARLTNQTFTNFIRGQLVEALILGVLCFVGMKIFGMPYAAAVSVLIAFTALIPVLGAYIGAFVGAFLIVLVDPVKALWFLVFIVVLQQIEGNLIYPKVVGKSVGLPGIFVLAAITVGGSLFGLWGMLLGVPLTSVLYTLIRQFVDKRLTEKHIVIK